MVQLDDKQDQALMRVIQDAQERVKLQSPTHL